VEIVDDARVESLGGSQDDKAGVEETVRSLRVEGGRGGRFSVVILSVREGTVGRSAVRKGSVSVSL
jgi:hypothetical protein